MGHIQWICADFMKDCDLSQSAGWEFVIQLEDPGFFPGGFSGFQVIDMLNG